MQVLDVGCGTGSISADVAQIVAPAGTVTGIDNTEKFIQSGKITYRNADNLTLRHCDLFDFELQDSFDLIISARMLQWLSNPREALNKMKSMLKPGALISILDYNHSALEWNPQPPASMLEFYNCFLRWRADAGMNNQIADDLPQMMKETGFTDIKCIEANEHYDASRGDFKERLRIWSKVASSSQMVEEGYVADSLRLQAIDEYNDWVENEAISMTMKLNDVQGQCP